MITLPRHQWALALLGLLAFAVPVSAQTTPPKNPSQIAFTSVDHAKLSGYEVDIRTTASPPVVVQTLAIPIASTTQQADGSILVTLNVQPIAFGEYVFVVRAVAGAQKSDDSPPSEVWDRVPGAPSKPTVK